MFYALTVININKECLVSPDSEIITVIIPSHYYENNFIRVFFLSSMFFDARLQKQTHTWNLNNKMWYRCYINVLVYSAFSL